MIYLFACDKTQLLDIHVDTFIKPIFNKIFERMYKILTEWLFLGSGITCDFYFLFVSLRHIFCNEHNPLIITEID